MTYVPLVYMTNSRFGYVIMYFSDETISFCISVMIFTKPEYIILWPHIVLIKFEIKDLQGNL